MADFPLLSRVDRLGLDTETTGVKFTDRPVGVSLSLPDGSDYYLRWGHQMGGNNCTLEEFMRWFEGEVNQSHLTVFMHSAGFDLRMLAYLWGGANPLPLARVEDTGFMAAVLNELENDYSLDGLGQRHLGLAKEGDELWEFCAEAFGGAASRRGQGENIWRAPGGIVAPYAKRDSRITLNLADHFLPYIDTEGLRDIYEMETALLPILLKMHMVGVKVDVDQAVQLRDKLVAELAAERSKFSKEHGDVNLNSTAQVAVLFDKLGIPYKRNEPTEKMLAKGQTVGNPSIDKEALAAIDHPVANQISLIKRLKHFSGTFVDNYVLGNVDDQGFIHGEFHPLRNQNYGTVSGRFSSGGGLNLQNIPARDPVWAPLIRGLFIPDDPSRVWCKADYSQIEYRFLAHYAGGSIMEQYNHDPLIDFHAMCAELVGIPRGPAKNINFGIVYGMGVKKMARSLGVSESEAREMLDAYHGRVPEVNKLYKRADRRASQRGVIVTWGGRKRRFRKRNPTSRRYMSTHKALNALLQGSAADLMKKAMILVADGLDWEETPIHLTVHDELDLSVPRDERRRNVFLRELRDKMESFDLRVPVKADVEIGDDWGHVKEVTL